MSIKTDRRNIITYIILTIVFVAVITPIFYKVHAVMEERLTLLEEDVFAEAEKWLGYSLEYTSVSPSILGHLEIRDLRIYNPETGENLLSVGRVNVFYSFLNFFKNDPLDAVDRISISNVHINYDPEKGLAPDFLDKLAAGGEEDLKLPRVDVSGRNISLSMNIDGNKTEIEKLFLSMTPEDTGWMFSVKSSAGFKSADSELISGEITGDISANGFIDNNFSQAESSITLKNLSSDFISVKRLNFLVNWKEKTLKIRKVQDRIPYDLFINYSFSGENAEIGFSAENFIPANYFEVEEMYSDISSLLHIGFTGSIDGKYQLNTGELEYSANLNVKVPVNEIIPIPVEADFEVKGTLDKVVIKRLDLKSGNGNIFYTGTIDLDSELPLPSGTLKINDVNYGGHSLSGLMYLDRQKRYYSLQVPWVIFDGLHLKDTGIRLLGDLDNVDIFIETTSADAEWENSLFAEGNFIMGEEPFFQILVESFDFPAGKSAAILLPDLEEDILEEIMPLTLNVQGYLSSDLEKFSFNASRFELLNREDENKLLSLSVSGNDSGLAFRNLYLLYRKMELYGEGRADWKDVNELNFSTKLTFQDIPYTLGGSYEQGVSLSVQGDYGLEGNIYFLDPVTYFSLKTEKLPFALNEKEYEIDMDTRGDFKNIGNWHFLIKNAGIANLFPETESGRSSELSFSGRFSPEEGNIYSINYQDDYDSLDGNGEFLYKLSRQNPELTGWIQLYNEAGGEEYSAEIDYYNRNIAGSVSVEEFPLARLGELPLSGFVSGDVSFKGPLLSPDIEMQAGLRDGSLNDVPVKFNTSLSVYEQEIVLNSIYFQYLNNSIDVNSGIYSIPEGRVEVLGGYSGVIQENPVEAGFKITAGLKPMESKSDIFNIGKDDINANLSVSDIKIFDQNHDSWDMDILFSSGKLSFDGGPQNAVNGYYDFKEGFEITVMEPMPMNFRAFGKLEDGRIEAEMTDISMNFQTIEKYFSIPGFTLMSGEAVGSLVFSGVLADPDIFGSLEVRDLTAMLRIMNSSISLNTSTININGKTLKIEDLIIKAEEGSAILNCEFNLDHLVPYTYSIYLETIYKDDPYLSFLFPGIRIEGYVKGILEMGGNMNEFRIGGDLEVHSGHVTVDPELKQTGNSSSDLFIDLDIALGNNNTFYWPSRKIPILKAYAESGETLTIKTDTAKNTFDFKGNIGVKGGEIFYFRRNFYLQEGIMVFNENKDRFNPIIDARAVIREVDSEGELIKIYLIADSVPLLNFEPRFESDPYRSNQEIVTLLGANLFNPEENDLELSDAIILTSDVVSQFGFVQMLQDSIKNNLRLDVFSLRSQIVPNLILERFLPEEDLIYDSSFARYLDNTTLFIGKYLGNDFFLQGVIQMDYYDANKVDDLYYSPEFNIDTEVTLEWKSPVALIELSLYPDFFDRSDALLTSSLSLSWSFSF